MRLQKTLFCYQYRGETAKASIKKQKIKDISIKNLKKG